MGERPLSELIAAVRLPHTAPAQRDDPGLYVQATAVGVHLERKVLSPDKAHELSRAIREALLRPKSTTVRLASSGQQPVMVCRLSEALVRVDGQVFARADAVQLAVALDLAAHQVAGRRERQRARSELVAPATS